MSAGSLLEVSDLRVSFRVGGLSARLAGRATEIEAVLATTVKVAATAK